MLAALLRILLPLPVALAVFAVTRRRRVDPGKPRGSWGGALAVGGGYLAGHAAVLGWPAWPPHERVDWLWYVVPAAVAPGLLEDLVTVPAVPRWVLRALVWGAALVVLLWAPLKSAEPAARAAWLLGLGVGGLVFWAALASVGERAPGRDWPPLLLALALGSAPVLFWAGWVSGTQLAACLAAALAASVAAAWWVRAPLARGAAAVLAVLFPSLWLVGHFSADLPAPVGLLLGATGPLACLPDWPPLRRRLRPWQAALLRTALVLVPLGAAVFLAWRAVPPESAEPYYGS